MRKLLVANWKENPASEKTALHLFHGIAGAKRKNAEIIICPPFVYLGEIAAAFRNMAGTSKKNLALGVQDIFWEDQGSYTSEIGPAMVESLGARYAIIGHSERRKYAKETDVVINKKIKSALKDGLQVILCVGEPLAIRKKGIAAAQAFIKKQLKEDLAGLAHSGKSKTKELNITIAYEPIWAIGTGRSDSPQDAVEMAQFIKKELNSIPAITKSRFLYGGSVNSKNLRDYVQYKVIDGALVGGASLRVEEFKKMINKING
jgi:triosephosphate isomerase (TIM)